LRRFYEAGVFFRIKPDNFLKNRGNGKE